MIVFKTMPRSSKRKQVLLLLKKKLHHRQKRGLARFLNDEDEDDVGVILRFRYGYVLGKRYLHRKKYHKVDNIYWLHG